MGYVRPATSSAGCKSQPCTSNESLFQVRLTAFPTDGAIPLFAWVSWVQSPTGPAQTSGGDSSDSRTTATVRPSRVAEKLGTHVPAPVVIHSSADQSGRVSPVCESSSARAEPPPAHAATSSEPGLAAHSSEAADVFAPSVRLRGSPPVAGTTHTSPPVVPRSLISPPTYAIVLPSGDHRGWAICVAGRAISRRSPETETAYSRATHQLLLPDPCAALSTRCCPSGAQSNS